MKKELEEDEEEEEEMEEEEKDDDETLKLNKYVTMQGNGEMERSESSDEEADSMDESGKIRAPVIQKKSDSFFNLRLS